MNFVSDKHKRVTSASLALKVVAQEMNDAAVAGRFDPILRQRYEDALAEMATAAALDEQLQCAFCPAEFTAGEHAVLEVATYIEHGGERPEWIVQHGKHHLILCGDCKAKFNLREYLERR